MPKRTNPFQRLVASIMAAFHEPEYEVTESVLVKDRETGQPREIDVLVRHRQDPAKSFFVECRNYGKRQRVNWIEELDGKKEKSLGFSRVVAVSSSGFSKGAETKARARGIETMWLREAERFEWKRFSLSTLGIECTSAEATDLEFVVPTPFLDRIPGLTSPTESMYIYDRRKHTRTAVSEWIRGVVNDPKVREWLAEKNRVGGKGKHLLRYSYADLDSPNTSHVECSIGSSEELIPLIAIVVTLEEKRETFQAPVTHYNAGGRDVVVAPVPLLGEDARLVMHWGEDGFVRVVPENVERQIMGSALHVEYTVTTQDKKPRRLRNPRREAE